MKTPINFLLLTLVLVFVFTSCIEDPDDTDSTGRVSFTFHHAIDGGRIESNESPDAVFISLRNEDDELILDFNRLELIEIGDEYITATLELTTGAYQVEDFIVVNEDDSALYLTPKATSELAQFVDTPLPHAFLINESETEDVILDVIAADYAEALSFGYATFSFNITDPLVRSLLAWYPFNGNANDSLEANDGTLFGNPAFVFDEAGNEHSALSFDGIDDYVKVDKSDEVNFDTEDFTIALTFRSEAINDEGIIFNTRNTSSCSAATGASFGMSMRSDGTLQGSARNNSNVETNLISASVVNDGQWHVLSFRRSGNELSMSMDHEVYSEVIQPGIDYSTVLDFYIGRTIYCSGNYLNGEIGDFRIFDRHLTVAEVHNALTN